MNKTYIAIGVALVAGILIGSLFGPTGGPLGAVRYDRQYFPGGVYIEGSTDGINLDRDSDTSISAPTDDQIDFEAGGSDVMVMNANSLAITGLLSVTSSATADVFNVSSSPVLSASSETLTKLLIQSNTHFPVSVFDNNVRVIFSEIDSVDVGRKALLSVRTGHATQNLKIDDAGSTLTVVTYAVNGTNATLEDVGDSIECLFTRVDTVVCAYYAAD